MSNESATFTAALARGGRKGLSAARRKRAAVSLNSVGREIEVQPVDDFHAVFIVVAALFRYVYAGTVLREACTPGPAAGAPPCLRRNAAALRCSNLYISQPLTRHGAERNVTNYISCLSPHASKRTLAQSRERKYVSEVITHYIHTNDRIALVVSTSLNSIGNSTPAALLSALQRVRACSRSHDTGAPFQQTTSVASARGSQTATPAACHRPIE